MTDHECWRCGSEGENFTLPEHPDGGGTICHKCWQGMYEPTPEQQVEYLTRINSEMGEELARLQAIEQVARDYYRAAKELKATLSANPVSRRLAMDHATVLELHEIKLGSLLEPTQ